MSPIDYANPRQESPRPRTTARNAILLTAAIGALLLLLAMVLLPTLGRTRPAANVIKCSSNLKQIGMAIHMYANDHEDQCPASFDVLIAEYDITTYTFICASNDCSDDVARLPSTATTQQAAASVVEGTSTCSYFLCRFPGLTLSQLTPKHVLAYEKPLNHTTKTNGMNVLFADGRTEWIPAPLRDQVAAELAAGQNPPPSLK